MDVRTIGRLLECYALEVVPTKALRTQAGSTKELSAVKFGWWPLIVVACRHYRLPLPLHLLEGLREPTALDDATDTAEDQTMPIGSSTE
jgi:hypothetical protein